MSIAESIPQQLQTKIDKIIDDVVPNPWLTEAEKTDIPTKLKRC